MTLNWKVLYVLIEWTFFGHIMVAIFEKTNFDILKFSLNQ